VTEDFESNLRAPRVDVFRNHRAKAAAPFDTGRPSSLRNHTGLGADGNAVAVSTCPVRRTIPVRTISAMQDS
jgi:hypothetical protein